MTLPAISSNFKEGRALRGRAKRFPSEATSTILLVLLTIAFATRNIGFTALALVVSGWLVASHLPLFATSKISERFALVVLVITLTAMLPVAALRNATATAHYSVVLISLGSAYVLTRNLATYRRASHWLLLAAQFAIFAFLAHTGLDDFPLERILPDSSSNGITSYLIVLQANYCIVRLIMTGRPTLVTPLLTVLICYVGWGRGSQVASVAIVAVNLFFFLPRRPLRAVTVLLFFALAVSSVYLRYSEDIDWFFYANTKIGGAGLQDEHREIQIRQYLGQIDSVTLITGADYKGTSIETDYNNNPHNTYIRAHHIFGLPYLMLMLVFPLLMLSRQLSFRERAYALAMIGIVLLRAFTETILFPTIFDFFFFAACFSLGGHHARQLEEGRR